MQTAPKKVINGWAMYDWANSVYSLVITTTIFPAYYVGITSMGNSNGKHYVNFFWEAIYKHFFVGLCPGCGVFDRGCVFTRFIIHS